MPNKKIWKQFKLGGKDFGIKLAIFIAIVGLWELTVTAFHISDKVFPSASSVGSDLLANVRDGTFLKHFRVTFVEMLAGFSIGSIGGFAIGVLVAELFWVRKLLYPYILAIQSIPFITLAPLFLIWFGFGISSKIALTVTIVFFPVLVNTVTGISNTDRSRINLLRAYSASPWQIFRRVKLPGALPYIFAGLEIAIVLSVIAAVISEFVGANAGLGHLIIVYNNQLNVPAQFSVFILFGVVGTCLKFMVQTIAEKVIFWQERPFKNIGL
jgi:NitT/TauT family transport system permease protein